ncbi:MAG: nitroreductase family protein [Firmicutes bacterium]|nr:nitroreductase family protein [Bacillota bacterium]
MTNHSVQRPNIVASKIDVLTAILERRSIRRYRAEPVEDGAIYTILQAGLAAPTAMNRRPFHFIVIKDRDTLNTLAAGKRYAHMLSDAQAAFVICGDSSVEARREHLYADCFAATQNMLLAIHGIGLGGVWLGVTVDSDWYRQLRAVLKLPAEIIPTAVISMGQPAEERPQPPTWDPEKIHYETW